MVPSTVDRTAFRETLATLAAKTQAKLPQLNGRVEKACRLVLQGDVELQGEKALVHSLSDPTKTYSLEPGHCTCADFPRAPEFLCAHRLAAGFARKLQELLPQEPASEPAPAGIDPRFLVTISGKPFVRCAGLLALAHERGLQSLKTTFTYNDADLALAECTATFPFGTFTDVGDATVANTNAKVRVHFRRVAATRATARALRLALGVDLVALEELEAD